MKNSSGVKIILPYKDFRCSRGCVHNYLKFNQKPPKYLVCNCVKPKFVIDK